MIDKIFVVFAIVLACTSCVSIPEGATAVSPFDINQYKGTWYEIARMDLKFERNLNNTTATYTLKEDGTVEVKNRGYNYVKEEWTEAIGKAKFVGDNTKGRLKVSFFGPFYGAYNVIALDQDYQYALVAGGDVDYMWILSRENSIPDTIKENYLAKAKVLGFKTDALIWVEHDK